jgi:hypothetical protein
MSEQKSKQELTRLAWITGLRRQGHRQCQRSYRDGAGGVCAMGLLAEMVGDDEFYANDDWAEDATGLIYHQTVIVMSMNDSGRSFEEIADVVASW